jgi:hypothetical protein
MVGEIRLLQNRAVAAIVYTTVSGYVSVPFHNAGRANGLRRTPAQAPRPIA